MVTTTLLPRGPLSLEKVSEEPCEVDGVEEDLMVEEHVSLAEALTDLSIPHEIMSSFLSHSDASLTTEKLTCASNAKCESTIPKRITPGEVYTNNHIARLGELCLAMGNSELGLKERLKVKTSLHCDTFLAKSPVNVKNDKTESDGPMLQTPCNIPGSSTTTTSSNTMSIEGSLSIRLRSNESTGSSNGSGSERAPLLGIQRAMPNNIHNITPLMSQVGGSSFNNMKSKSSAVAFALPVGGSLSYRSSSSKYALKSKLQQLANQRTHTNSASASQPPARAPDEQRTHVDADLIEIYSTTPDRQSYRNPDPTKGYCVFDLFLLIYNVTNDM